MVALHIATASCTLSWVMSNVVFCFQIFSLSCLLLMTSFLFVFLENRDFLLPHIFFVHSGFVYQSVLSMKFKTILYLSTSHLVFFLQMLIKTRYCLHWEVFRFGFHFPFFFLTVFLFLTKSFYWVEFFVRHLCRHLRI